MMVMTMVMIMMVMMVTKTVVDDLLGETVPQSSSLRAIPIRDHLQKGLHCRLRDQTLPPGPESEDCEEINNNQLLREIWRA